MFSNILIGAAGFPVADLGDEISQSLRFRGSQILSRTSTTNGNRRTWTLSCWFKKSYEAIDGTTLFRNDNGSVAEALRTDGFDKFETSTWVSGVIRPTNRFRDQSAWYHFVWVFDSTQSTASERQRVYINGVRASLHSYTAPSLNAEGATGGASTYVIGGSHLSSSLRWEGYIADVYFIDGTAISETNDIIDEFGKINTDGVWVPQNYTGSYGTNGYHLTFDSSQTNGIGHDSSGNGNDFTASGFDTAAISSSNFDNDVDYNDTPTSNYATLNPLIAYSNFTNSNANLTSSVSTVNGTVEATIGVTSGQWYWEVLCQSSLVYAAVGVSEGYVSSWTSDNAFVYTGNGHTTGFTGGDGNLGGSSQAYGDTYSDGDVIGVALDMDGGTLTFFKNGVSQGTATSSGITGKTLYPVVGQSNSSAMQSSINLGQMPFIYTPPTGFSALQTNNLPEPTIKNGKEHFDVVLYTGNGGTQSVTGLEFQPDLVWIKDRDSVTNHAITDSVRGPELTLSSDANAGESPDDGTRLNSFDTNGFTVGSNGNFNANGDDHVAWCWKAGGTAVSNTDGTITSSVSANTVAGFSIVEWERGTNTTATIGHGLDSPPEFIISKALVQENWSVYHVGAGNTGRLVLNLANGFDNNNGAQYWDNTDPGNDVFTVGNGINTNATNDMIAYCWHSVPGYSAFGIYNGNSNADGPMIVTGFKPAWVMIKSVGGGGWLIFDTTRTPNNVNLNWFDAQSDAGENTSDARNQIDFLSNGFKLRGSGGNTNDTNGKIYACFAEHPFGGENAPPVTAR